MPDPLLFDLMHGISVKPSSIMQTDKKLNRYDAALDQLIKEQVDKLMDNENPNENKLISKSMRRVKLQQELQECINFKEFGLKISRAVEILKEGNQYLDKNDFDFLLKSIDELKHRLGSLNLFNLDDETLQNALKIPRECGPMILNFAISRYLQGMIDDSLALFLFLTLVNPGVPDYWFRFGLVAKKSGDYTLALSAFETTSELVPEFIGAHIYSAYCYFKLGDRENALAEVAVIRQMNKSSGAEDNWQEHIHNLEILVANFKAA